MYVIEKQCHVDYDLQAIMNFIPTTKIRWISYY